MTRKVFYTYLTGIFLIAGIYSITPPQKEARISFPLDNFIGKYNKYDSLSLILNYVGVSMSVDNRNALVQQWLEIKGRILTGARIDSVSKK
jgi:hypothetical protein